MNTSPMIATKPSTPASTFAISTTTGTNLRRTPGAQRLHHRLEPPAAVGEHVLGVGRRGRDDPPFEHACSLLLAQPLGECARRHAGHGLPELVEARGALEGRPD